MSKINLTAAIVAAFIANPTEDKLLVASDGNCFKTSDKAHANYHSRTAEVKITEAKREDYAKELEEAQKPSDPKGSSEKEPAGKKGKKADEGKAE